MGYWLQQADIFARKWSTEGADPGFPRGRRQPIIQRKFSEELHENEKNWSWRGARPKFYYVNQPLDSNVMKFGDNELQRAYFYSL